MSLTRSEILGDISVRGPDPEPVDASIRRDQPVSGQIIDICAFMFEQDTDDLLGAPRKRPIAYARFAAWHLMRRHTSMSLPQIGSRFNGRHHTTIMSGIWKSEELLADPESRYAQTFQVAEDLLLEVSDEC